MLLERGANPNAQLKLRPPFRNVAQDRGVDKMQGIGATPLILAAAIGDVESVTLLLEHGALADLSNTYGVTPLLVSAGVNFSFVPTRGRYRTEEQTLAILQLLLDAGADINTLSGDPTLRPHGNDIPRPDRRSQMSPADRGPEVIEGKNALHGAARHGWLQVAQFLIDYGVRQQVVDDSGRTPLDYAKGLYPPAFNDSPAEANQAMIELLTNACNAQDNCNIGDDFQ
jgi:ankyrin repeat protein